MSPSLNHKGTEVFKKTMTVHLYGADTPDVHMPSVITKFFIYLNHIQSWRPFFDIFPNGRVVKAQRREINSS